MKCHKTVSALLTVGIVTLGIFVILAYGSYHASEPSEARKSVALSGSIVPVDYSKRVERIVKRLENEEYGMAYAPWNRLMMHGFLASSLGYITRTYPEDLGFRTRALEILDASYKAVDSDVIRPSFSQSGTIVPYGIIYQAGRLKILEQLATLDTARYQDTFFSGCDAIASMLEASPRFTAESYTGWGWYVDNADAYHALWMADGMREKNGQQKRYTKLIASWTGDLATHAGVAGLPLAEAYRPGDASDAVNQVRGSATGWLLWDLCDIDRNLAEKFFASFEREFSDSWTHYTLVRDVARDEKKINNIFDGPKLGPYSSSATILSVPIFRVLSGSRASEGLLRAFDTLVVAPSQDSDTPDWFFGGSLLLDILRLWAEVAKPLVP